MYGGMDALVAQRLRQMQTHGGMARNAVGTYSSRRMIGQYDLDPRVSVEDECGFPPIDRQVNPLIYRSLWERNCIAMRVVNVYPKESWQVQPQVYETEQGDQPTEFEDAWDCLGKQLVIGGQGWHSQEHGSPIWEYLLRADILSGIGQYGIILLGLDDGQEDMRMPVKGVEEVYSEPGTIQRNLDMKSKEYGRIISYGDKDGNPMTANQMARERWSQYQLNVDEQATANRNLLYLRVFPEHLALVTQWERNPTSPRYGFPNMYLITFNDYRDYTGIGAPMTTIQVHWTRVIHIVDTHYCAAVNECFGVPRMRPVLNNLLGLHKLYGGSPEMYWKGALPGMSLETHPQLGGEVEFDEQMIKDQLENYFGSLQRYMVHSGMSAKMLSPTVVDPTAHINGQVEAIAMTMGMPKRVFMGTERGELASSQDDQAWNDRLRERQADYITPRLICPFINRLIMLGVLPIPSAIQDQAQQAQQGFDPNDPNSPAPTDEQLDQEEQLGPGEATDALGQQQPPNGSAGPAGKPKKPNHRDAPARGRGGEWQFSGNFHVNYGSGRRNPYLTSNQYWAGKGDKLLNPTPSYANPTSAIPFTDAGIPLPTAGPTSGMPSPHGGPQPSVNPPAPMPPIVVRPKTAERLLPEDACQEPEKPGFKVLWPDLTSQSKAEKATVANTITTALGAYVSQGVQNLIQPLDYLTRILGMEEEEAMAILQEAQDAQQQEQMDQEQAMAEQGLGPDGQPLGGGGGPGSPAGPGSPPQPGAPGSGGGGPGAVGAPPHPGAGGAPGQGGQATGFAGMHGAAGEAPAGSPKGVPSLPEGQLPAGKKPVESGEAQNPSNPQANPVRAIAGSPTGGGVKGGQTEGPAPVPGKAAFAPGGQSQPGGPPPPKPPPPGAGYNPPLKGGGATASPQAKVPKKKPLGTASTAPTTHADTENVFCPTGEGGGVDPSCAPGGAGGATSGSGTAVTEAREAKSGKITEPPCCPSTPTPSKYQARVGVHALQAPPPPQDGIPRLPNLTRGQRAVESRYAETYLKDPDHAVANYEAALKAGKVGIAPNVYATDDIKMLNRDWNPGGHKAGEELGKETKEAMAKYNTAVHNTANAISKKAFLNKLDEIANLPDGHPQKRVLVTNGGCAAGKGSSLARVDDPKSPYYRMMPAMHQVGAVWDAAGEQNATENAWIAHECSKRGIKGIFAYVWADPKDTWEASDRGVVRRAMRKGRMVDARLFADSYAEGAKNMHDFVESHKGSEHEMVFIDNRKKGDPKLLKEFPKETLKWDAEKIYSDALKNLDKNKKKLDPTLYKAGKNGEVIWGKPYEHGE
jgi:hypothetical protein